MRARLDRENGNHGNQLIWEGPVRLMADPQCERNSFLAMDRWLAAVEKDQAQGGRSRRRSRATSPRTSPTAATTATAARCRTTLCPSVVHVYGTPRTVAGDAITTDNNKCRLKPLSRGDYAPGVRSRTRSGPQLQAIFPDGVCDFSKRGVDQQPTIPWQTYQDARGRVIYGGRPLAAPPRSTPLD